MISASVSPGSLEKLMNTLWSIIALVPDGDRSPGSPSASVDT